MLLADISFMDVFWSMVWFFFLFILIMILFQIFGDLFRDQETSGVTKTLWVLFLLVAPPLAMLVYLIVRGGGMAERAAAQAKQNEAAFAQYVQSVNPQTDAAGQIAKAKELLDSGAIDQAEYERLKAKALA